ncbi:phage tail protein I [Pseudomonas sp. S75]|uniref:phage tail protein I n=1 Tax=unclassified Pseudomonas TaxID=196821 RepID=UPI001907937D|nr:MULTISPECIES: phage tail protein I [unclassified Pseudomonas]MBJ9975273.1 phage tail protein I [Pseudomonas sp. S30]MBK0152753.1 phage tail protein I [Pseudomonas sp. S75]
MTSLLPLNRTRLERSVEAAGAEEPAIMLRRLYDPDTCPSELLYLLAWAWSVDRWDDRWPEPVKRSVIRSSFSVHAHKGTIGALRRVVEPFGYLIEVLEWWQTVPQGVPGTFALKVGIADEGISEETYLELTALIDDARPVSRHMTGLAISLEASGRFHVALLLDQGDELDVYPPAQRDIQVTGAVGRGGRDHTIDTLEISHG